MLYSLDEITLIPAPVTYISSRSECSTTRMGMLPLFVSPMSCLVDASNVEVFQNERLNTIVPRSVPWKTRMEYLSKSHWVAVGLKEANFLYESFDDRLAPGETLDYTPHISIDQANGHMNDLLELCKKFKTRFGKSVKLMVGNIAHPHTYYQCGIHGVDYVRVSVGSGSACTTSCQTGFHYPMGSLLIDIKKERENLKRDLLGGVTSSNCIYTEPKIIADGGFKTNDQIIKALALGADYVMLGSIIGKSEEACGPTGVGLDNQEYRKYYGMSTEEAQIEIGKASMFIFDGRTKRAEGVSHSLRVEYSIRDWISDFDSDLRSAMSYANALCLSEFIGNVRYDTISKDTYLKFMGKVL